MKLILSTLFFIIILVFLSVPNIEFKPFTVTFEKPYTPFAMVFLVLSIILFNKQAVKDSRKNRETNIARYSYKLGVSNTLKSVNEKIKETGIYFSVKDD